MQAKDFNPFKFETWIGWLAASLVFASSGTAAVLVFVDGKFQTKEQAQETQIHFQSQIASTENHLKETLEDVKKSLDKLDDKLDKIISSKR